MHVMFSFIIVVIVLTCTPMAQANQCDSVNNCSSRASSVTYNTTTHMCDCHCTNGWNATTNCSTCPDMFNSTPSCSSCAAGYGPEYPHCFPACSVVDDCSNHSYDAMGYRGSSTQPCVCSCKGKWRPPNCSICPSGFQLPDCAQCAPNYVGAGSGICIYCTPEANCSRNAFSVSGNPTTKQCVCSCRNHWNGSSCESCPPQYIRNFDCNGCSPGYVAVEDLCLVPCTTEGNCSSHATGVVTTATKCDCQCVGNWTGPTCNQCNHPYDPTKNCSACLPNYINYPHCTPTIKPKRTRTTTMTVSLSRTDTASTTSSETLSVSAPFSQSSSSTETPSTSESETSEHSRSPSMSYSTSVSASSTGTFTQCGHNTSVCLAKSNHSSIIPPKNCQCSCIHAWSEVFCNYCHFRYNETEEDCSTCARGYVQYPTCDFITYVTGNWSIRLSDERLMRYLVRRRPRTFFEALSADVTQFVRSTITLLGAAQSCNASRNITAYITGYDEVRSPKVISFAFDILDQSKDISMDSGMCLLQYLYLLQGNRAALNQTRTVLMDLVLAEGLISSLPGFTVPYWVELANFTTVLTVEYPCMHVTVPLPQAQAGGDRVLPWWCNNIHAVVDPFHDTTVPFPPWAIAIVSILGISAVAVGIYLAVFKIPHTKFMQDVVLKRVNGGSSGTSGSRPLDDMEVELFHAGNEN